MRIRFQFNLSEPIQVPDKWPIKSDGVIYSLEGKPENITGISAVLQEQSIELAPAVSKKDGVTSIDFRHGALVPRILERLDHVQCTLGILLPIEIDTEHYKAYFEPENSDEESKIVIKSWSANKRPHNNRTSFDIAIKGLLCDPWPASERYAAQFYRRARRAINERFFVDAFVNYYFFLERLYADGKFKSAEVTRQFNNSPELKKAYERIDLKSHDKAIQNGVPLKEGAEKFFAWIVNRRGFFQHQSETDPQRWLHSTQELYADDAFVLADFAMGVYYIRNADRVFNSQIDGKYMNAAEQTGAIIRVIVDIIGDDAAGQPVRHRVGVNGPGTRTTRAMAREILLKAMQIADERLVSVSQITATVDKTHELLFVYNSPATMSSS